MFTIDRKNLFVSVVLGGLAISTPNSVLAASALARFNTLTVTLSGPGINFLDFCDFNDPFGCRAIQSSGGKRAEADDELDSEMAVRRPYGFDSNNELVSFFDGTMADAENPDIARATAGLTNFRGTSLVFNGYEALAEDRDNKSHQAEAESIASLSFKITGDPQPGDLVNINFTFAGESIIEDDGEAFMDFLLLDGLSPNTSTTRVRIDNNQPIVIPQQIVNLQSYEGGEIVSYSVQPKVFAKVTVPEPSFLPAIVALGFLSISKVRSSKSLKPLSHIT